MEIECYILGSVSQGTLRRGSILFKSLYIYVCVCVCVCVCVRFWLLLKVAK
jgi:hypothetical protein